MFIFAELTYFGNYKISLFLEVWKFLKYVSLKSVQTLNSKIMYVSMLKYMSYVCIYASMHLDRQTLLYVCMCVLGMYDSMYVCPYIGMHACLYVCMHTCLY